jgi:hypothetical protein
MIRFLIQGRFYGVLQGTIRLLTPGRRPVHDNRGFRTVFLMFRVESLNGTAREKLSGALASQGTAGLSDLYQGIWRSRF